MKPNKRILPLIAAVVCMPISVYAHGLGKAGLINADWTPIQGQKGQSILIHCSA